MFHLILLWHLFFTLPDTLIDGRPFTDYKKVRLYRKYQSPTWVAMYPAMLIDTSVWDHFWPIVRAEAGLHMVGDYTTSPITLPDSLTSGYYYLIVVRQNGIGSSLSNQAAR